jgi:hypothetical protein
MHRSSDVIRPKSKVAVELVKDDGETLEGFVYVGGQERILDLLNNHERFIPLELSEGRMILINKNAIVLITPFDEDRMAKSYRAAPMEPQAPVPHD